MEEKRRSIERKKAAAAFFKNKLKKNPAKGRQFLKNALEEDTAKQSNVAKQESVFSHNQISPFIDIWSQE